MPTNPDGIPDGAVSDVVATAILLALSVSFFSVIALKMGELPAPVVGASVELGVATNATGRILLSSYGGDPVPVASLAVRLGVQDCPVQAGPAAKVDGPREDGDGAFVTGERVLADCDATPGGVLTVVGGAGDRRRVLLHVSMPPLGGGQGGF